MLGEVGVGGRPRPSDHPYEDIDLIDPNDPILYEGELWKYKSGFKGQFISRWVQVTVNSFRYFASKPQRDPGTIKPLMAIPILAIKEVQRVKFELPI